MSKGNKAAIAAIIAILALSSAAIAIRGIITSSGRTAVIYKSGEIVREIRLDSLAEVEEFDVTDDNGRTNTVRAERGRIRITHADCPDKVCVNQGWITNGVVPIVCLPNEVTIEIHGGDMPVDCVTGGR